MLSALLFAVTIQDINCSHISNWCVLTVRNKKGVWESGRTAPLTLNLGTGWGK